jgi:hypothetical protein
MITTPQYGIAHRGSINDGRDDPTPEAMARLRLKRPMIELAMQQPASTEQTRGAALEGSRARLVLPRLLSWLARLS